MTAVHQFIPTLAPRDAIGRHTLEIQATLRDAGLGSDIFAFEAKEHLRRRARPYRTFRGARRGERTAVLYHVAIGSPIATFLARRSEPLLVDYHNVTPPEFFDAWEPGVAHALAGGRHQLVELRDRCSGALADSDFNRAELVALGYETTAVLPILFDPATLEHAVDERVASRIESVHRGTDWLFVGRLAPNKSQHELIKAFCAYRRAFDSEARLRLVGASSSDRYESALRSFVHELGLEDAVEFAGSVSDGELGAHYATADVFVCVSEHEGFLVPLLEAMHYGVPIVAYARTAVPETLSGGGLALPRRDALTVATAVDHVMTRPEVRKALVASGRERLGELSLERGRRRLLEVIQEMVGIG